MAKPQTVLEAREALNQIGHWMKRSPHFFRPMDYVRLYAAWRECVTPEHVETLRAHLRELMLTPEQAEAQKESTGELIRRAEASRAAWFAAREEAERQGVPDPPYPASTAPEGSEGNTRRPPAPSTQPNPTRLQHDYRKGRTSRAVPETQ